ncbi:hypothetical protein J2Z60_002194, partial [Lactobacillus colini]|nr:hypothetical protein [Lactobacillus colini]
RVSTLKTEYNQSKKPRQSKKQIVKSDREKRETQNLIKVK